MPAKRAAAGPALPDPVALDFATRLIHQVCCFAGSFDLVEEFRDQYLIAAVAHHDTAALFNWLMHDFSFQGISDQIAADYLRRHGQATWRSVRKNLSKGPSCPKLQSYWAFHDCRYEKTSGTCAEPDHIASCPLPSHRLRNGHLNQLAYSLYLFIRDVADADLVGWIDERLSETNDEADPDRLTPAGKALIEPLRNVYGVSDKVLTVALSGILIGTADVRPNWLQVGVDGQLSAAPGYRFEPENYGAEYQRRLVAPAPYESTQEFRVTTAQQKRTLRPVAAALSRSV